MKSIFLCNQESSVKRVYSKLLLERLKNHADLSPAIYSKADVLAKPEAFSAVQFIFSTWGMPSFSEAEIRACFPSLRCVFYAAGSVQEFARPFLNCGVRVFSAWAANAVPVADYAVSQILLANKGFYSSARLMSASGVEAARENFSHYRGNYGASVGIIGAGMIGKMVIRKLREHMLTVKVFDPFLPDETAAELGAEKCSLEELFSECTVISNHLANNAQTKGMLDGRLFSSMQPYSTLINTGRGAQIVEADLADVLRNRPDMTAILDVTEPEPPISGHPFYQLPNCILTPHIAGSIGDEVCRMAEYMTDEFMSYLEEKPCKYEVSMKMLQTMA